MSQEKFKEWAKRQGVGKHKVPQEDFERWVASGEIRMGETVRVPAEGEVSPCLCPGIEHTCLASGKAPLESAE